MEKVAFLWNGRMVLWPAVFVALGALAALLMALSLRVWRREKILPVLIAAPLAVLFSLLFGRLIHWYCRFESYAGLSAALADPFTGDFSLIGAFLGTLLACVLVRLLRLGRDLPRMLDAVSVAGALGIAVGRLGALFSVADRGKMIFEDPSLHRLPFSAAVANATSGALEWRFATFCFQSIWAALVFVGLLVWSALTRRGKKRQPGETFLLFLQLYCLGQILLDSTRYDALFLRSNGFVSLEQIVCGVVVVAITALYSVLSIRSRGFRLFHPAMWLLSLAGLGLAGYMEYYVQRHGDAFLMAYALMALGLAVFFCAARLLRRSMHRRPARH